MLTINSPVANLVSPISVLLIDDDQEFRKGLHFLLDFYNSTNTARFNVVGHAASVEQAISLAKQQSPSLILLDLQLAQETGIEFLKQKRKLSGKSLNSHVLVISAHREDEWIYRTMQAGAQGYLLKENLSSRLYDAISTVMSDEIYLSREAATRFFRMFNFYSGNSLRNQHDVHLTEREYSVLQLVVEGATNEMIAEKLHITVGTAKCYLTAIFQKLEVKSRTQAAMKALKLGVISG